NGAVGGHLDVVGGNLGGDPLLFERSWPARELAGFTGLDALVLGVACHHAHIAALHREAQAPAALLGSARARGGFEPGSRHAIFGLSHAVLLAILRCRVVSDE